jgi:DNA-binding response OmpR family regulator
MSRILIIGEDEQTLNMIRKILEPKGYEVVVASDWNEGARLYREAPTDLVIKDLNLYETESLESMVELRQDFPEVKIIAVSGGLQILSKLSLSLADSFGADYTFTKPVQREELFNAVEELLQQLLYE